MSVGATALAETSQPTLGEEAEQVRGFKAVGENLNTPEAASVYHRLPSGAYGRLLLRAEPHCRLRRRPRPGIG